MKFLLDTHVLLWAAGSQDVASVRLPAEAVALIDDPANELLFSAVSLWEVVIKTGLGRADFRVDPHLLKRGLLDHGYVELAITADHALAVRALPVLHKDPFDRMLVAQATAEGAMLMTVDAEIAAYPGPILHLCHEPGARPGG